MILSDEQAAKVIAEAKTWIGTNWHHQGRIKGAGVDCGMFLLEVYERAGIIGHVIPPPYPADWHMHRNEEKYLAFVEKFCVQVDEPKPADIVTYRIGRCISHAAIVIKWPLIIHSVIGQGVVMDDAIANVWFAEHQGHFYRYNGGR
jgi:cell wall-associated NlpC family hydrolase